MPDNFDTIIARILGLEGGYANVAGDRGGETYRGISRVNWPNWVGWAAVDRHDYLGADLYVKDFYREHFWNPLGCDGYNEALALELMDIGVNSGVGTAIKLLQRLCNVCNNGGIHWPDVRVDGSFGPVTRAVVTAFSQKYGQDKLARLLNGMQMCNYVAILEANPGQEKFAWGWLDKRVLNS